MTYLTAGSVTVNVSAGFTASATLINGISSAPVSGKTVLFTFQASTQTAVTNSSGIASVSYTAPASSGVYNYTASFAGDGAYTASSDVDNAVTVTAAADVTPPLSRVVSPAPGSQVSVLASISGTASDAVGLSQVRVSLKRWSDSKYWSGTIWGSTEAWNMASGTGSWSYSISSAALTSGTTYLAMSKAYDLASNTSNPANSSSTFTYVAATVVTTTTYLTAGPVTVSTGASFVASATLIDDISSAPVSGKTVLFAFQASTQTAITNSSGTASVSYTAPASSGVYNYTASFAGDGAYSASSDLANAVTVTVAADVTPPLSRVVSPATGSQVSAFTNVAGTAYDAGGLSQVRVSLKRWSDSTYWSGTIWGSTEAWNLASGTANWTYTGITSAALNEGTTYLAMSKAYDLAGNISNPANSSSTFTYVAATVVATTTYLTAGPVAASVNASFTASATLISSTPISGRTILFTFQASTQTAVTNGSGVASVAYTAPASTGVYNYTASFAGDGLYQESSDLTNTVTVGLRPTGLVAQNAAAQASSTFTATATLTDTLTAGGISGKSVLFTFQGSTQIAVTNGIGVASVIYTAPGISGSYNYTASFSGDSAYASAGDSTNTVTVGLIASSLLAQNAATQVSSTFTATATLISSSPVSGKMVLFNFQGSTQTAVTNGSGVASVIYTAPGASGSYNYTASFAGDSSYAGSSDLTNTVTVGLRPTGLAALNVVTQANAVFVATATLTDNLTTSPIAGKTVLFTFQAATQTAVTDGTGRAVVTYTAPGTTGSYNYTANFAGDSAYASSSDSTNTVTVGLRPTGLVAQNAATQASSTFTATATLTDNLTAGLVSGKSVLFMFQGSTQSAVTNGSGVATVVYTAPGVAGTYNYTASFAGDSAYASSSDSTNTVSVGLRPTVMTAQDVTTQSSEVFTVSAIIRDGANNNIIPGKTVSFIFQSVTHTAVTNASGTATTTYTAPVSSGAYGYTAGFAGDSAYSASSSSASVSIGRRASVLAAAPATAYGGNVFTAAATLTDNLTAGLVAGKSVTFLFQGSTQTAVTNASGVASVTYTAPAAAGAYNYTASFAGDLVYTESSDLVNAVTVNLRPTAVTPQSVATQANEAFTATAVVRDGLTSGVIPGKTVSFVFQSATQTAVTDSSGVAATAYTAPASPGSYIYTANFAGDAAYAASAGSAPVSIARRATVLTAAPASVYGGNVFSAAATFRDSLTSTLLSGNTVSFVFQGLALAGVTNSSGTATVTYTAPPAAGSYNYTANCAGDSVYAASSDPENVVTVILRPTALAAQDVTSYSGDLFTAVATLTDTLTSGVVAGKAVAFVFQGLTQAAVTNSSGTAVVSFSAAVSTGLYNYTASFAGDAGYAASGDSTNTVTNMPQLPARPSAPVGSAMGVSSITWSWNPVSAVSGYRVYLATSPSSLISTQPAAAYLHTGLSPNTTYGIVVAGVNDTGVGPVSLAGAPVSTLANPPSGAAPSAVYATSATFNWGINGNPAGTIAKLLRVNTNTTFTTSTTTYADTGLLGCTTYTFRLWNINRAGIATQYSALDPVFTGNPAPLPPGNLSAESLSGNRIRLTWEPAPFEGVTGYILYSDNGTGTINYGVMYESGLTGNSFTTGVLTSSAAYKFGLRARHRCGVVEGNTSVRATAASIFSLTGVRAAIKIPQSGKKVKGNSVTVMAELVTGTVAETKNIRLQYKAAASGTWSNIIPKDAAIHPNPDTTSPYFIHWDVTGLANGSYDLRAIATALDDASDQTPAAITIAVDTADADINEDDSSGKVIKEQKVNNLVTNILQAGDSSSAQVTKLEIPAGALDDSTVTVSVTNNPTLVPPAPADAEAVGIVTEITLSNTQTELAGGQTAAVTLLFPDADNDGIVDGTNLRASQLEMYSSHNLSGPWEKDLSSTVDLVTKKVIGYTSHFSFFALFAPQAADINSAKAYPVPWRPGSGDRFDSAAGIGFYSLTDKTEIRIYTITGQLVRELKLTAADNGNKIWDGKNSSGLKAASGVYLAHIKSGSSVKILKIAVER